MGKVKVGDEFAFRGNSPIAQWQIYEVSKVMPSGRFACGPYTCNPDGTVRGRATFSSPFEASKVTDRIRRSADRHRNFLAVTAVNWTRLSDEQLESVARLVESFKSSEVSNGESK
jgi:hypothetical protein